MKVKVARKLMADGTAEFQEMSFPKRPEIAGLSVGGKPPTLYPSPVVQEGLGLNVTTLHKFMNQQKGRGVVLPNTVWPQRENMGGNTRFFTDEQVTAAVGHYALKRRLKTDYYSLSQIDTKKFFGVEESRSVHRWLDSFPEVAGGKGVKEVFDHKVVKFIRRKDPEYFIPKELADDEEKFSEWARKVKWERKRKTLPKGFQDYVFAAEIGEEKDARVSWVRIWANRQEPYGLGVTLDGNTHKPRKVGERRVGEGPLIFSPEEAEFVRAHFEKRREIKMDFLSVSDYGENIGVQHGWLLKWLKEEGWDPADKPEVFGLPVEAFQEGIYMKNTLGPGQVNAIRNQPTYDGRLGKLATILSGQRQKGPVDEAGSKMHPLIRQFFEEGLTLADMYVTKRKELAAAGFEIKSEMKPFAGGVSPTYKLMKKQD
ncbi:MAG: hypothetical protein ABH851_09535 [Methanobacteriota archaeon]